MGRGWKQQFRESDSDSGSDSGPSPGFMILGSVLMTWISPDKGPWENLVVVDPSRVASVFTSAHKGPQGRQTQQAEQRQDARRLLAGCPELARRLP